MKAGSKTAPSIAPSMAAASLLAALWLFGCSEASEPEPSWQLVFEELDATVFSVWGSAEDDIWVVGAGDEDGSLVMRYDGSDWRRLDLGTELDLWWVSGRGDEVWMSGEAGLVARYSRADDDFELFENTTDSVLFGIFPFASDDVWAVGGDLRDERGVVLHFDGSEWSEVMGVPSEALQAPLFKVWGRAPDDLWIVGLGEVALHFDGDDFNTVEVPTGRRLLTVHGNDDDVVAVGGFASGLLVEGSGSKLVNRTPDGLPQLNGVWVEADGTALAGGAGGALWRRRNGKWAEIEDVPSTRLDYHAVFVDPAGGQWAVGGQVNLEPFNEGIVAHRGTEVSSKIR